MSPTAYGVLIDMNNTPASSSPEPIPGDGGAPRYLTRVEHGLVDHVADLLATAGVPVTATPSPGNPQWVDIAVPARWEARARATLDLVLPGLLDRAAPPPADSGGEGNNRSAPSPGPPQQETSQPSDDAGSALSARLVRRSDWTAQPDPPPTQQGPGLIDGRHVFGRPNTPSQGQEDSDAGWIDDDGDFEPPEPPPIPRGDTTTRFAWFAAIGGPVLMLASMLLGLGTFLTGVGLATFVSGFAVLVARMDDKPRQDDGWDDGAVL